ncbi:MAG: carbohydrate binding family 9 domain-containing protein [Gemmatimonadetes bacterium]|nr:carbohydrate binding family 9 domain-containing protein [Gemmatimonadota bacterium]
MFFSLLAAFQLVTAPPARPPSEVYRGRENEVVVRTPRIEDGEIELDGRLDEPVWGRAALLTGFSEYEPVDGMPAEDSTEVLVWYSPNAIYFGIRAHEPHGAPRATLADRDKIDGDDYIQILLDTFHDGRRALVFGVNAFGVQSDGIRSEGGGNAGRSNDFSGLDLSPDFLYESKGRLTEDGYEVELRIPFKSLRYQSVPVQSWGIQVLRKVQHSGHQQTWTPARKGAASFIAQSGTLDGLRGLHRGLVLDLNPVATTKVAGAPAEPEPGWSYDATPELGGNVRWGITSNLTLNGTVNPDFSQVEADAGQLVTDPRQALFFAEKRPFFLDGIEQFQTPGQLIYTRRILNPVAAGKVTGKLGGRTDVGFLSAVDEVTEADGRLHHPVFNLLRVRRDVGAQSTAGLVYTDRTEGSSFNRVAGADTRIIFKQLYYAEFQSAVSFTGDGESTRAAPAWQATLDRTGRHFGFHYTVSGTHRDFEAQSGFLDRTGVAQAKVLNRFTAFGPQGGLLENYTVYLSLDGRWEYDRFTAGRVPDDMSFSANNNFSLRGGWHAGAQVSIGSSRLPTGLYDGYAALVGAGGAADTVAFGGRERIPGASVQLSLNTPQFQRFAGSVSVTGSRDVNFDEWAPAYIGLADVSVDWRPTERVRVNARYLHQRYVRVDDHSVAHLHSIPRLKVEYQLARPIFLRFVGQYDSEWRDALRDADGRPILVAGDDGVLRRSVEMRRNDFRADWLFSYQPNPGTVLFAGYGSSLASDAFTLRDLRRESDGFFFKISYLFRM